MTVLWHFTCHHGATAIGPSGYVLPASQHSPAAMAGMPEDWRWMAELAWFTDLSVPDVMALGLTRRIVRCDRTRFRYRVQDNSLCVPWLDVLPTLPRRATELSRDYGLPGRWWVSREPVPVILRP